MQSNVKRSTFGWLDRFVCIQMEQQRHFVSLFSFLMITPPAQDSKNVLKQSSLAVWCECGRDWVGHQGSSSQYLSMIRCFDFTATQFKDIPYWLVHIFPKAAPPYASLCWYQSWPPVVAQLSTAVEWNILCAGPSLDWFTATELLLFPARLGSYRCGGFRVGDWFTSLAGMTRSSLVVIVFQLLSSSFHPCSCHWDLTSPLMVGL